MLMITSIISLAISPYTPLGVCCEIYPSLGGNIERVKSQYSIFQNDILYCREHFSQCTSGSVHHTLSIWLQMEFTSIIFLNHQFALNNYFIFLITNEINSFITKSLRNSFFEDFFKITSRNFVFGFTSSKSHLLPLLFNALEL